MIPQTYDEWKRCIVNDCGIKLTKAFAAKRLAVYLNEDDPETQRFISLYGTNHLQNIINWFKRIES